MIVVVRLLLLFLFCSCYGDLRDLHVLTHSFPTRRSSDLPLPYQDYPAAYFNRLRSAPCAILLDAGRPKALRARSEEHTSELQSLMRISYAVFCLKKKKDNKQNYEQR